MNTEIGHIYGSNRIGILISYVNDPEDDLMEGIDLEVSHDEYGTPVVLADQVMQLLEILAEKMQGRPIQNIYPSDNYNY